MDKFGLIYKPTLAQDVHGVGMMQLLIVNLSLISLIESNHMEKMSEFTHQLICGPVFLEARLPALQPELIVFGMLITIILLLSQILHPLVVGQSQL
jgi:hypothetical protein